MLRSVLRVVPPVSRSTSVLRVGGCVSPVGQTHTQQCDVWATGGVRGYRSIPGRVKKHRRKQESRRIRALVKFAERYDPIRKCRITLRQTMSMMGWPFNRDEEISEDVKVDAAMEHKYLVFNIAPSDMYTYEDVEEEDAATGKTVTTSKLVVNAELAEKEATCLTKGFKTVWVPQDQWTDALSGPHAHRKRADLLLKLTIAMYPYENRYHL